MFDQEFAMAIEREQNPSVPIPNHQMDDVMDKLKLLNYEKLLLKFLKLKPPNRRYFLKSRNPGEQFYLFTSLCAWLARNLGKDFDQPQEFDDPSAIIAKIIRILQEMVWHEIAEHNPKQLINKSFPGNSHRFPLEQTHTRRRTYLHVHPGLSNNSSVEGVRDKI